MNFVKRKYIAPKQDEAVEKAMSLIRAKVDDIKKESIAIVIVNMLVIVFASQLISNEIYSKLIISVFLLATFLYAIVSFFKHWKILYEYINVYKFNYKMFIFQKIYEKVRSEVEAELENLNSLHKFINKKFGKGQAELSNVITDRITHLLLKNIMQMTGFFLFFFLLYNFYLKDLIVELFTGMGFYEILFYPFSVLLNFEL